MIDAKSTLTKAMCVRALTGHGKVNNCAAAEGSFTALTGLLEVEPLHFTCISTSDGTRVERDDASMFTGKIQRRSSGSFSRAL